MTPDEVRQIIRDELKNFLTINGYTFDAPIKILDARNIALGKTNGTKFGTEPTQKLAFYGETPISQHSQISKPSGGGSTFSSFPVTTGVDSVARAAINDIIDFLTSIGLTS